MYDNEIEEVSNGTSKLLIENRKNMGVCADCGITFVQGFRINPKTGEKIFNKYLYYILQ